MRHGHEERRDEGDRGGVEGVNGGVVRGGRAYMCRGLVVNMSITSRRGSNSATVSSWSLGECMFRHVYLQAEHITRLHRRVMKR